MFTPFERGTLVVVTGIPLDHGSGGRGEKAVRDRVVPGMTGVVAYTDSIGTVHVQWDAGFRLGIEGGQSRLLRRIVSPGDSQPGQVLVVCTGAFAPGQFLKQRPERDTGFLGPVWTESAALAQVFDGPLHAARSLDSMRLRPMFTAVVSK